MAVNFGDIRSAIHSGGELPEGWMEDERAREYVRAHIGTGSIEVSYAPVSVPIGSIGSTKAISLIVSDWQIKASLNNLTLMTLYDEETGLAFDWANDTAMSLEDGETPPLKLVARSLVKYIRHGDPLPWR